MNALQRTLATAGLTVTFGLLAVTGAAQDLDLDGLHELDDDRNDLSWENLSVDQLEDLDVMRDGEVIGEVEEVLGNQDEEIVALVVEYGGRALGIGEREVIVPIEDIEIVEGRAEISLTNEELEALTAWQG